MDKVIYISDLDGTLLNNEKKISRVSADLLNELIDSKALHFSVATARTPATVENILSDVHMKEWIIVMNGVALYDLVNHQYHQVEYISSDLVQVILKALGDWTSQGFIYTITEHKLTVYYDQIIGEGRRKFYEERKNLSHKKFVQKPLVSYDQVIYFVFIDTKARIQQIYDGLQGIEGIDKVMYQDIYCEDSYLLEVYSHKATKSNGIKKLKELGGYHKVIAFGDQLNDKSMFELAQESYAVENATSIIKEMATGIIGSNEEDSVARFIKTHLEGKSKEENKC